MGGSQSRRYSLLIRQIYQKVLATREEAIRQLKHFQVVCNYEVGRMIVEFEQGGEERAEYGEELIRRLAEDLTEKLGQGFSATNLKLMRQFYLSFPLRQRKTGELLDLAKEDLQASNNLSLIPSEEFEPQLSWSHYCELIKIDNILARSFYEKEAIQNHWSVRELRRQIGSALFERLALSQDKEKVLKMARKGQIVEKPEDLVKDPYILEFLDLEEPPDCSENDLEEEIINKLQYFLLEIGKGFSFVRRQYRIKISHRDYFVDLVFYNRLLKCFVLVDLKTEELSHADVGQMNLYLNYFKEHKKKPDENDPIGIILAADKDELFARYVLGGISNRIFASQYSLALPPLKKLKAKFRNLVNELISSKLEKQKVLPENSSSVVKRNFPPEFRALLPRLEQQRYITTKEVMEILDCSRYLGLKLIKKCIKNDLLRKVGKGRATRYEKV